MATGFRSVRLDQAALDRLLLSSGGDVGRFTSRVGGFVTRAAKRLAEERLEVQTGEYLSSFVTTSVRGSDGLRVIIANLADHATYVEEDTRSHVIRPKRPGGFLVFEGRNGDTVFAREVHHLGTTGKHILRDSLRIGLRQAGVL